MLRDLGYSDLVHDSHVPFLSHLIGTRRLLVEWGCTPALCDAGLFHSVYGTEYFEPPRQASRDELRALVGTEAERLAWLWCAIERATLDPDRRSARLRDRGEMETLSALEIANIATLWAADTVEQISRMAPHERSFAATLGSVIHLACEPARRAVDQLEAVLPLDP